jgi:hypothetical protein
LRKDCHRRAADAGEALCRRDERPRFGQQPPGCDQDADTCHEHDDERGVPAEKFRADAADIRRYGGADHHEQREIRERARHAPVAVQIADGRSRNGETHRRAEGLHDTAGDQSRQRHCEDAHHRAHQKHHQAGEHRRPAAIAVRQRAADENAAGERDQE